MQEDGEGGVYRITGRGCLQNHGEGRCLQDHGEGVFAGEWAPYQLYINEGDVSSPPPPTVGETKFLKGGGKSWGSRKGRGGRTRRESGI